MFIVVVNCNPKINNVADYSHQKSAYVFISSTETHQSIGTNQNSLLGNISQSTFSQNSEQWSKVEQDNWPKSTGWPQYMLNKLTTGNSHPWTCFYYYDLKKYVLGEKTNKHILWCCGSAEDQESVLLTDEEEGVEEGVQWEPEPSASAHINKTKRESDLRRLLLLLLLCLLLFLLLYFGDQRLNLFGLQNLWEARTSPKCVMSDY